MTKREKTKEEKEKDSIIEYMIKYSGMSYRNAMMRFEKWSNDRISNRIPKRKVAEGKRMTTDEMQSIIIYLHKQGYVNTWISNVMGIFPAMVSKTVKEYEDMVCNNTQK